jgi:hypothetical protein
MRSPGWARSYFGFSPQRFQIGAARCHVKEKTEVHRVQKFIEDGSGRIGYAMTAAALSEASNGTAWQRDSSFSVADSILDNSEFVSLLRAVLRDGHVIVPPAKG